MRGSSRKEEGGGGGERMLANEFINACEEEGAKHVRDDTLQVRKERKPCVKASKSKKSKIGQTVVVVGVVMMAAIFFLDSKMIKKKKNCAKKKKG